MPLVPELSKKHTENDYYESDDSKESILDKEIIDTGVLDTQHSDVVLNYDILKDKEEVTNKFDDYVFSQNNDDFSYDEKDLNNLNTIKKEDLSDDTYDVSNTFEEKESENNNFSEIENLEITFTNNAIIFKWSLPNAALGVKIFRSENKPVDDNNLETSTIIAENAKNFWIDSKVEINNADLFSYHYLFKCMYQINDNLKFTKGVEKCLHFENTKKEKCEIEVSKIMFKDNTIKLPLKEFNKKLEKIFYKVNKDKFEEIQIPDDIINNNLKIINKENYIKNSGILLNNIPGQDLYITLVGQIKHTDGWLCFSEPSYTKVDDYIKSEIRYQIIWQKSSEWFWSKKTKNCRIVLQSQKKPPELILAYRTDKHIPLNLIDNEVIEMGPYESQYSGDKDNEYIIILNESILSKISSGTPLRLFLKNEDKTKFELTPENISELKVP